MTDSSPLVSVITPVYNAEKFIESCLGSLIRQSYQNWEQIIVDDGSTDRTAEIIRGYSDSRIRYFHQSNTGIEALAKTYNRALGEAKGELIAILEGDDMWPDGKLAALVPGFADPQTILAYGIPREINIEGEMTRRFPRQVQKRLRLPHRILFNDPVGSATAFMLQLGGNELVAPSTVVIRRSALEAIGGFQSVPDLCTTDLPTFIRLTRLGKFYFTPEIMGYRRVHSSSSMLCNFDRMSPVVFQLISDLLREFGPSLSEREREAVHNSWRAYRYAANLTHGRLDLLRKEWREARRHFWKALHPSLPRVSGAAMLGWLLSWVHCTMEPLFRLAGRAELTPPRLP